MRRFGIPDAAETLDDLRVPPGKPLEALLGDRAGGPWQQIAYDVVRQADP